MFEFPFLPQLFELLGVPRQERFVPALGGPSRALEQALRQFEPWLETVAGRFSQEPLQSDLAFDGLKGAIRGILFAESDAGEPEGGVHLEMVVTAGGISVSLLAPSTNAYGLTRGWRSLRARMLASAPSSPGAGPEALLAEVDALPDRFRVGPCGQEHLELNPISVDSFRRLLDESEVKGVPLAFSLTVSRAEVLTRLTHIADELEAALLAFGPLFRLLTEPYLGEGAFGRSAPQKSTESRPITGVAPSRRGGASGAHRPRPRPRNASDEAAIEESLEGAISLRGLAPVEESFSDEVGTPRVHGPVFAPRSAVRITVRRSAVWGAFDRSAPIEPGSPVHVLEGVFAGKQGVVQDLDGRGGARVFLGLFATNIPIDDLARSRDSRPSLPAHLRGTRRKK